MADYNIPLQVIRTEIPRFFSSPLTFLSTTEPLGWALLVLILVTSITWVLSLITGNCSQVDRLWSVLPAIYVWLFAAQSNGDIRLLIMASVVTLWGLRLTYNFWRKGGYSPNSEDYRWPILRKTINNPIIFLTFHFLFIHVYQNILLFLISLPAYVVWVSRGTPLVPGDFFFASLFFLFLLGETVSDQQQWNFQNKKYELIKKKLPREGSFLAGFLVDGLFRYSRHPNFFCEIMMWWCFYGFSVTSTGVSFNWSIIGTVLLTLLFQGSTAMTESLTLSKYPLYAEYQACTSCLVPRPPQDRARLDKLLEKSFNKKVL